MNKTEFRIQSKIIKQISLFLLMHGINHFAIELLTNHQDVTYIIKTPTIDEDIQKKLIEKLNNKRQIEVETYGWELMGDTDARTELDILGSLIDSIEINNHKDQTIIKLTRLYSYKNGKN